MSWWGKHNKIFGSIGIGIGIAALSILTAGIGGAAAGALGASTSFGAAAGSSAAIGAGVAGGIAAGTSNYQGERQAAKQEKLADEQAKRQQELASQAAALNKGQQQTLDTIADNQKKSRSAIRRSIYTNASRSSKLGA